MKKTLFPFRTLLLITGVTTCTYLFAGDNNRCSSQPNRTTIKVSDSMEVKKEDELGKFTWDLANKQCASYCEGWHLPSMIELGVLYHKKNVIGGFKSDWYWSSSEFFNDLGRSLNFLNGTQNDDYNDKKNAYFVRCVKTTNR